MKNIFSILLIAFAMQLFSQTPQGFNYSAVARDATGKPLANRNVSVELSILKTSPTGALQYAENHSVNTDGYGLFNLVVGNGAVQSGNIINIQWGSDSHYLKVAIDANGGSNYITMGTTQIMSVPYALHAKKSDNGVDRISATGDTLYLSNGQVFVANSNSGSTSNLVTPTVTTNVVTGITSNSATFGGNISNALEHQIVERGIVYATSLYPTVNSNKIIIGSGIGTFDSITSMNYLNPHFLQSNITYYVRAYVTTENNILIYGNQHSFTTLNHTSPTITSNAINITSNGATFTGSILNSNGHQITERGFVFSTESNPTYENSSVFNMGSGLGTFDTITDYLASYTAIGNVIHAGCLLDPNTTYFMRAYALTENNVMNYGNEITFTTLQIGQTGPGGGIVFYDKGNNNNGWQYLEAAPADQSNVLPWGCFGLEIQGIEYTIGSGQNNTTLITANCNEINTAAKNCENLVLGGKSDWFLPSRDELFLMKKNGILNPVNYWSSSQHSVDPVHYSWYLCGCVNFDSYWGKGDNAFVRAIRAF